MAALSNPYDSLYALVIVATAFLCAHFLAKNEEFASKDRFPALDGLRGFAALFVFIHHSAIWWSYALGHPWTVPPSNLYTQFGQGAVTTFFLLTSFLFWTKMGHSNGPSDWPRFFLGRMLRIAPLYMVTMLLLVVVAYVSSPAKDALAHFSGQDLWHLLLFTFNGLPNLFGLSNTFVINAGVTWTLPYEWTFYLALPALAVIFRAQLRQYGLALVWIFLLAALAHHYFSWHMLLIFPFGMLVSDLVAAPVNQRLRDAVRGYAGSVLIVAISGWIVWHDQTAYCDTALVGYASIFFIVASGNSLFGLLTCKAARKLGEISYSIYLLQGFGLYFTFEGLTVFDHDAMKSPWVHWLLVDLCGVVLLGVSALSYKLIEYPALNKGKAWGKALRSWIDAFKSTAQPSPD